MFDIYFRLFVEALGGLSALDVAESFSALQTAADGVSSAAENVANFFFFWLSFDCSPLFALCNRFLSCSECTPPFALW